MPEPCRVCEADYAGGTCPRCGTARHPAPAAARALPPGTLLQGGHYALGSVRGAGGFGITYAAFDRTLRRRVAVKEFFPCDCVRAGSTVRPADPASAPTFARLRSRFLDEARALARCAHPAIVPVHAFFEENETAYIVMEWVEGRTLQEVIEGDGALSAPAAVATARQIGAALEVVHAAGLAHRDVKPDNVLVTAQGRAMLLDFGTARAFSSDSGARATAIVTPGYAPPEQYAETAPRGPALDVYALAATLYHAVSGRAPVPADQRRAGAPLDPPPGAPIAVAAEIMRGLALDEAERPATVGAFVQRLESALASASPAAEPPVPPAASSPQRSVHVAVLRRAVLSGHGGWVRGVAFSPDGATLASGSEDRTVRLWDVATGTERIRLDGAGWIDGVAFADGGRLVAAASHDGSVRVWSVDSGEVAWYAQERAPATALAASADGALVAAGFQNGSIVLWQAASGVETDRMGRVGHSAGALAFRADGAGLAVAWKGEPAPGLWAVGGPLSPLPGAGAPIRCLSAYGQTLAGGASDGAVALWDLSTRQLRARRSGHHGAVLAVAFASGTLLISGGQDHTIRLWDLPSGREVARLEDHAGAVAALSCATDGGWLASGAQDGRVLLWSVARG